MYRLALSGRSGSGKGYAGSLFREKGIPTLDTDALVHRLYAEPYGTLPQNIAARFGEGVLREGIVDRGTLRRIVFADKTALQDLGKIVHGEVRRYCLAWLSEKEAAGCIAAVVDAPQLFEAGMESDFDGVIVMSCPENLRLQRIMARDGISMEDATLRLRQQLSEEEYLRRADFVLCNDEREEMAKDSLSAQIDALIAALPSLKGSV